MTPLWLLAATHTAVAVASASIGILVVAGRFHRREQQLKQRNQGLQDWLTGAVKAAAKVAHEQGYEQGHADGTKEGLEFDAKARASFGGLGDYGE